MTEVQIKVKESGPLVVSGPFTIVDADGNEYELPAGSAVVLCRCGASLNKPFCDKTHQRVGFVAAERAPVRD
jgi:CDGSH-type Zn-finger protein